MAATATDAAGCGPRREARPDGHVVPPRRRPARQRRLRRGAARLARLRAPGARAQARPARAPRLPVPPPRRPECRRHDRRHPEQPRRPLPDQGRHRQRHQPERPHRPQLGHRRVHRRQRDQPGRELPADLPDELGRRARHLRPPARPFRAHPEALPGLLQPSEDGLDRESPDQRHRRPRPARHRRRHVPGDELAHLRRRHRLPLHPRLAPRTRDARHHALPDRRDTGLPRAVGALVRAGPQPHRRRERAPAGIDLRGARPQGLPARAERLRAARHCQRRLSRRQLPDGGAERPLLPLRRVHVGERPGDRPLVRRVACDRRSTPGRRPGRVHRLPVELLRPTAAALAALQHLPVVDGRGAEDLHGARHRARHAGRARRGGAAGGGREGRVPRRHVRLRRRAAGAARHRLRAAVRQRRSPSSGRPGRASRPSSSCLPASTTPPRAPS